MMMYRFNGNTHHHTEHINDAWSISISKVEMGLTVIQTDSNTLPLPSRILGDCGDGLEVPFSALDLQDMLGMGAFGAVYKAVLRNPYYPHRAPRKCAVKLLKGNIVLDSQ